MRGENETGIAYPRLWRYFCGASVFAAKSIYNNQAAMKGQKGQKGEARLRLQKLRHKLKERLCLNNIHSELQLITKMNRNLQISLDNFMTLDLLRSLPREDCIQVISSLPFLKLCRPANQCEYLRLEYQNSQKLILVTGIQRPFIEEIIAQFNSNPRRYSDFPPAKQHAKITATNSYWITIETSSDEAAASLKKYLRNEKRNMDENPAKQDYKIERRRIRIIIVKEDLFTLLIDAMTEYKAELFLKNFQLLPQAERRKSQQISTMPAELAKNTIIYRPLVYNNLQSFSSRTDTKEEELSDGFSESNSLNSDIFDSNKMKDIIQTSDQGIQSESNAATAFSEEHEAFNNVPSNTSSPSQGDRTAEEVNHEITEQIQHQQYIILRSDILRSNAEEFGLELQLSEQGPTDSSPAKKSQYEVQSDSVCTEKHSPLYKKPELSSDNSIREKASGKTEISCQTQQPLYTSIPIAMMRRFMQQFKHKSHSQLVQLPQWLKSESENERNRHRFFSSLCKPKLFHRGEIQ